MDVVWADGVTKVVGVGDDKCPQVVLDMEVTQGMKVEAQ